MTANILQMELQNFTHAEALSCVLWKMAQSLFVLIILPSLQMCCRKKKRKTKKTDETTTMPAQISNETTGTATRTAIEANQRKTGKKANNKIENAKTIQRKEEQRIDDPTQMEGSDESDRGNVCNFYEEKKNDAIAGNVIF
ncbi:hypothetical protein LOAG_06587 [Loa loa]|uniref:Uncharacterized protein n=1 Tax=Loa loa TaxID=7209 RepID=A0A1S0TXN0_LOALO|nr:hypothetical protein LOAG_06587 [Loa loa]EFO21901.1 hypothetical protein LOAG_06587 [Loa loa]